MADRVPDRRFADGALERMLAAWRDWRTGAAPNPLGYARAHAYTREADMPTSGAAPTSRVPTLFAIARTVDVAFGRLRAKHRLVLAIEYLRPDLNLDAKAAMLGLSRRAYCRRVDLAKRLLAGRLAKRNCEELPRIAPKCDPVNA